MLPSQHCSSHFLPGGGAAVVPVVEVEVVVVVVVVVEPNNELGWDSSAS